MRKSCWPSQCAEYMGNWKGLNEPAADGGLLWSMISDLGEFTLFIYLNGNGDKWQGKGEGRKEGKD